MKRLLFLGLAISLFTTQGTHAQNVGELAPDFNLKTLNNNDYVLSENRGDVIAIFFVGHSCPFCIASSPFVNTNIIAKFEDNEHFQLLIIDTWNGSVSAVTSFKNTTGLDATYLLNGRTLAQDWGTTYDRLSVIDSEGILVFKGKRVAKTDSEDAAIAIEAALANRSTGVEDLEGLSGLSVSQNYPNPASDLTHIEFNLASTHQVRLSVMDLTGKLVEEVTQEQLQSGSHNITLNVSGYTKGMYFYRLESDGEAVVKRMIVK